MALDMNASNFSYRGVTGVRLYVYQINRTEAINTRGKSLAQEVQLQTAITPTHHRVIVHSFHSIKHNPKYQIGQVGIALEKSALQQKEDIGTLQSVTICWKIPARHLLSWRLVPPSPILNVAV